jgi:hypothetical protein
MFLMVDLHHSWKAVLAAVRFWWTTRFYVPIILIPPEPSTDSRRHLKNDLRCAQVHPICQSIWN